MTRALEPAGRQSQVPAFRIYPCGPLTRGAWSAFDARWEAGVPFTMVIAPGGKMLYQQQGELDIYAMRRSILANLENNTYVGHPAYWAAP